MPSSIRLATTVNKSRSKLEQIASTAPESHTVTTVQHQRRCAALFQPKGRKLTDPVRAPAWPQRKNFGHSPAFAIGLMARDGKPQSTQEWMVPCATAEHQLPLRTSLTA